MRALVPDGVELAQPLHNIGPGLLDDMDIGNDQNDQQDDDDGNRNPPHYFLTSTFSEYWTRSFTPSIFCTFTWVPAGMAAPSALRAVQVLPST